ncbi:SprT family protein [Carnobacteriaceae bacterium zg-ZUI252]|nr:SprT family protein [Carnobacteriaceae bacterium zg-ZUI252]
MSKSYSQEWLQQRVEAISIEWFHRPFMHIATWNTRLKTTGGRYHLKTHHLDFNPDVLTVLGIDQFDAVIKHELCHYHLHLLGLGYRHGDDDFKKLLKKVDGTRFVSWGNHREKTAKYTYQCLSCAQKFHRNRRIDTQRFACGKCKGRLQLIQEHQ